MARKTPTSFAVKELPSTVRKRGGEKEVIGVAEKLKNVLYKYIDSESTPRIGYCKPRRLFIPSTDVALLESILAEDKSQSRSSSRSRSRSPSVASRYSWPPDVVPVARDISGRRNVEGASDRRHVPRSSESGSTRVVQVSKRIRRTLQDTGEPSGQCTNHSSSSVGQITGAQKKKERTISEKHKCTKAVPKTSTSSGRRSAGRCTGTERNARRSPEKIISRRSPRKSPSKGSPEKSKREIANPRRSPRRTTKSQRGHKRAATPKSSGNPKRTHRSPSRTTKDTDKSMEVSSGRRGSKYAYSGGSKAIIYLSKKDAMRRPATSSEETGQRQGDGTSSTPTAHTDGGRKKKQPKYTSRRVHFNEDDDLPEILQKLWSKDLHTPEPSKLSCYTIGRGRQISYSTDRSRSRSPRRKATYPGERRGQRSCSRSPSALRSPTRKGGTAKTSTGHRDGYRGTLESTTRKGTPLSRSGSLQFDPREYEEGSMSSLEMIPQSLSPKRSTRATIGANLGSDIQGSEASTVRRRLPIRPNRISCHFAGCVETARESLQQNICCSRSLNCVHIRNVPLKVHDCPLDKICDCQGKHCL